MKMICIISLGFLCWYCGSGSKKSITLFEKGATTWFEAGEADWKFENNALVGTATGGAGFVMTGERYKDFELQLEFYPDSTVNSGIFIRCANREISNIDCYEMNIWDLHPDQEARTGAVVTRAIPTAYVETLNKWNTYRIVCNGELIKTWVNGTLTADMENTDLVEGYIGLQAAETGTVKFRNVRLEGLPEN